MSNRKGRQYPPSHIVLIINQFSSLSGSSWCLLLFNHMEIDTLNPWNPQSVNKFSNGGEVYTFASHNGDKYGGTYMRITWNRSAKV